MGYRLIQTRDGCMLFPTPSAAQRRKARQRAKSVRRAMARCCKVWHGDAAQAYYEQLVHEGKIKPTVSDNVIRGRVEVADAPPEGARPQVHNAGCAMKPPGQSVGTDSKTSSLAQKNVLTLAPALRAGETAGDSPSRQMTGPGSCQAVEPNPSPNKGSRQLPTSYTTI
jgi:hypothetical protein